MLDPEDGQGRVDHAIVGEHEAPDQRVTHHRRDNRDEEDDAQDAAEPLGNALEPVAQADRDHQVQRSVAGGEHDGVAHDRPERRVLAAEHAPVVFHSDEAAASEDRPVIEGDHEGRDQGQDDEEKEAHHSGRQVDEGAQAIAPPTLSARGVFAALGGLRLPRARRARGRLAAGFHSVNAHKLCTPFRRMSVGSTVPLTPSLALTERNPRNEAGEPRRSPRPRSR